MRTLWGRGKEEFSPFGIKGVSLRDQTRKMFNEKGNKDETKRNKGAYWIIQRFLVHYQILHLPNIAIAILYFSLLLPIKLSLLLTLKDDSKE